MDRRAFVGLTAATAANSLLYSPAFAQSVPKAKNVALVHGLFADGSCWSEVIPRLQVHGLNVTSVQNPLTTLLKLSTQRCACSIGRTGRLSWPTTLFRG